MIESTVVAWSGVNGRAGLEIRTPLRLFLLPLSMGACGRLIRFLNDHVNWTACNTPGATRAMMEDRPAETIERPARQVDGDDRAPVTDAIRHRFLQFFFAQVVRDQLMAADYVAEKIDHVWRCREMWELEGMLHPSVILLWRVAALSPDGHPNPDA